MMCVYFWAKDGLWIMKAQTKEMLANSVHLVWCVNRSLSLRIHTVLWRSEKRRRKYHLISSQLKKSTTERSRGAVEKHWHGCTSAVGAEYQYPAGNHSPLQIQRLIYETRSKHWRTKHIQYSLEPKGIRVLEMVQRSSPDIEWDLYVSEKTNNQRLSYTRGKFLFQDCQLGSGLV